MEEYVIDKIMKEHEGKEYTFPLGAKAENVKTDTQRQFVSQAEKNQIEKIAGLEKSFRDGCNTIVAGCTACGETPESNSPAHIVDAIRRIYGRNRIKEIYQHDVEARPFEAFEHTETVMELWDSFAQADTKQYNIALDADKLLYNVTFDLVYYAIAGYDSLCQVAYSYSLKTVEGVVIQEDSIDPVKTGTVGNYAPVTKNILVDLLQAKFTTASSHLILTLGYSMSGQVTSSQEQMSQASITFSEIKAHYK